MLPLFDSQPPTKLTDAALNALANGSVVVTANARAARSLILHHAERQQADGFSMWASPAISDWDTWLNRLWQEHAFANPNSPLLLTPLQEHALWKRVQQNDASLVVSADALASLAQSAYAQLGEYELHHERTRSWFETDAEHFRHWAKNFDQLCRDNNWTSRSKIESLIMQACQTGTLNLPKSILLVGFDLFTPAQQSLLNTLREAGVTVDIASATPSGASTNTLVAANDEHDQLLTCAAWCRHMLQTNPAIRIGVIAPDIRSIRADMDRVFRSALMPESLNIESDAPPMPFEFSLGVPLSTIPVVRAALLLLRWISKPLLEEDISWLVLSGFFHANNGESLELAKLDFKRRDSGALSPETPLPAFVSRNFSTPLSKRLSKVLKTAEERHAPARNHSYSYWADLTTKFLQLAEWPGLHVPDSMQFQAQQRWLKMLDEIALLDLTARKISYSDFLQTLEREANETTFTPESHRAPIQILGVFESSGLTFDAVWFLGVDDAQWPQTGRPHPLLPVALQRQTRMPHSSAATDTEHSIVVTRRISVSAPKCILSYARQNKERELRASPILKSAFPDGLQNVTTVELREHTNTPEPSTVHSQIETAVSPSQVAPWTADRVAGGADVLKDQAACPFRGFAKRRFAVQPLNRTEWGLDAAQRGKLLHSILEAVWSPQTVETFRLVTLDDLKRAVVEQRVDEILRHHIQNAFARLVRDHAEDPWMQAYLESEQRRLRFLLHEWMSYEAERQPFTVAERESSLKDVSVGDLKLNLRADRIDELPDGSHVLIDYKTGEVSPSAWKGERLDEPQLPLYATYGNVERVSALLFAQIRAGKIYFVGRAAAAHQDLLADLSAASSLVTQPYSEHMHDEWRQALLILAEEFLRGEASVDPKQPTDTCKYCPLPGLCRVAERDLAKEIDAPEAENV